jgi:hypothetical protein
MKDEDRKNICFFIKEWAEIDKQLKEYRGPANFQPLL